ncbi:MAG: hypothetical protein KJ072_02680 [Verrucomicrobia bacterium]|nr:hypothetical protein [Verrucomicrobiota bacterium]
MDEIFCTEDEQVWRLTLRTAKPSSYRILWQQASSYADKGGDTAAGVRSKGCEDVIWIVVSHVTPSGDGPAYVKTIVRNSSGSFTVTRDVSRDFRLGDVVVPELLGPPTLQRLNEPIVLADMGGQRIRLMVGEESYRLDAERVGDGPGAPLLHSDAAEYDH